MQQDLTLGALLHHKSGDDKYDRVFDLLVQRITYVARRRVPEDVVKDIVQDTLLILLEKLPDLDSDTEILPYTFIILRKVIGNYYHRERSLGKIRLDKSNETYSNPADDMDSQIYFNQIMEKCEKLNGDYSEIMKLVIEGYSTNEIADKMGCTSKQVLYNRIHRSRKLIKLIISEDEPD
jgi:RNA polymerase sigma factor (sigma-70 family)